MDKHKILIVDDEPIITKAIGRLLQQKGYVVTTACSGEKALKVIQVQPFDLVITDLIMGDVDGLALLQKVKQAFPETMVMLLTGHGELSFAVDAMRLGADDFLVKPAESSILCARVEKCLEKREALKLAAKAEQAIQNLEKFFHKFEALSTMAAGIAHQFNNALAEILGNIELLKMDYHGEEKIFLRSEKIKKSIEKMNNLTTQLLIYAKGGRYRATPLSLSSFLQKQADLIMKEEQQRTVEHGSPMATSQGDPCSQNHPAYDGNGTSIPFKCTIHTAHNSIIKLEFDLCDDELPVNIDNIQMELIFSAIYTNACEAVLERGTICFSSTLQAIKPEHTFQYPGLKTGNYACLKITDSGVGMDKKTRSRVLEPFFSTKFQGRGMGMAAVFGVIKNHNGWISIDSEPGRGTTVMIFLPLAQHHELQAPLLKNTTTRKHNSKGTILLVEDEKMVMDINFAILDILGYDVLSAGTAMHSLDIAKNHAGPIDIILLDVILPDLSAGDLMPLLKKARPKAAMIICSRYPLDLPAQKLMDQGADQFVEKPFSIAKISEVLSCQHG